jgi:hypothetical protein
MARLTPDEIEKLEAHADRGQRWLFIAGGCMLASLVSLAAGAPYNISLFLLSSVFGAIAISARDLVPVYKNIIRMRRWNRRDDDGAGDDG